MTQANYSSYDTTFKKYKSNDVTYVWISNIGEGNQSKMKKIKNIYNWCDYHKKRVAHIHTEIKSLTQGN